MNHIPNLNLIENSVQEYLEPNGWNMEKLNQVLPWDIVREICTIHASSISPTEDSLYWKDNKDGNFSVKFAYDVLTTSESQINWNWKKNWKIQTTPKIAHFLWTFQSWKKSSLTVIGRVEDSQLMSVVISEVLPKKTSITSSLFVPKLSASGVVFQTPLIAIKLVLLVSKIGF